MAGTFSLMMMIPMIEVGQNASLILIWIVGLLRSQVDVACHCVCDQFFAHERDVKIPMWWFRKAHSTTRTRPLMGSKKTSLSFLMGLYKTCFSVLLMTVLLSGLGPKVPSQNFLTLSTVKLIKANLFYCISESSHDFFFWICFSIDRDTSSNVPQFSTFQKPLNKYLYIPFESFHPSSNKKAFIKGELMRYARNSSSFNSFHDTREKF